MSGVRGEVGEGRGGEEEGRSGVWQGRVKGIGESRRCKSRRE